MDRHVQYPNTQTIILMLIPTHSVNVQYPNTQTFIPMLIPTHKVNLQISQYPDHYPPTPKAIALEQFFLQQNSTCIILVLIPIPGLQNQVLWDRLGTTAQKQTHALVPDDLF